MKEAELNSRVSQLLNEFENIEDISLHPEWNYSLMEKLSAQKHHPKKSGKGKIISILLMIIIANVGLVVALINKNFQHNIEREIELRTISKELLVNPISINN